MGVAFLVVLAGFSVNYGVDPYSVFGSKLFPEYGQPQERYLKIEWLKKHPDYNTILLGSSRIGVVNVDDINEYVKGVNAYNLSISQANQWDVEMHIGWLVKNMPQLSHIIVQIDWPSSYGSDRPGYALLDEIHPDISGRNNYSFLIDYLTLFNLEGLNTKINNNKLTLDRLKYDMDKGYWSRPFRDQKIVENCIIYRNNESSFKPENHRVSETKLTTINNNVDAIKRYKKLLTDKNIKLTLMLTPINHLMLDEIEYSDLAYFINQLVGVSDFYNFMYYNKITNNDCNYYESSHYRPLVGKEIIRTLFENSSADSEIYSYVTPSTIIPHLNFLKALFSQERVR
ncbi:MAG: hypothetical protein HOP34_09335 [Methylococcaceae bacterium]|nr:hypothetical protein [Methylococcaceae bacterium]